jgi:murein DD-endopeptidase MepM/ murein hydrolase activator NlpD
LLLAALTTLCLTLPAHTHVLDPFRAPPCDRCAGNRGLDLATSPGTDVRAATNGTVTFAGLVAGRTYVVVRANADRRVRVTYGGLAALAVARGHAVAQGESLGTAADTLFYGVRVGDRHVDPLSFTRASPAATPESATPAATPESATPVATLAEAPLTVRPRFRITLGVAPARACAGGGSR